MLSTILELGSTYQTLAIIFGFLMAWGVGANDVANAMGTSVGSKAVTLRQAILMASIFEFLGAFFAGGNVTDTIRKGILDAAFFADQPDILIIGMLASLLSTGIFLVIATYFGWPVSTTHAIVGAILGFGASIDIQAIQWAGIAPILIAWVISPFLGGILAYCLFISVQYFILERPHPIQQAKRFVPVYIFLSAWIVASISLHTGVTHIGIVIPPVVAQGGALLFAAALALLSALYLSQMKIDLNADRKFHFTNVERIFGILMVFTGCTMAFAHGSNDVSHAIGPVATIVTIINAHGSVAQDAALPSWVLLLGASGIVVGLLTYGHRVIATIGEGITQLTPTRGFAATLAAATTVAFASGVGLPVSTTHTLVGAILGVGLARGIEALNMAMIQRIFISWAVTLPASAFLSVLCYYALHWVLMG